MKRHDKPQDKVAARDMDTFDRDLHPHGLEGQNLDNSALRHPEKRTLNARDYKEVHRQLADRFTDDELVQIHILPVGTQLQQNATYFDLQNPEQGELKPVGYMEAQPENWYIPKNDTPYWLWNRLLGVEEPERLDLEGSSSGDTRG